MEQEKGKFSFKKIIVQGVALALPLAIVAYLVIHFLKVFETIISPVAEKAHIETIFGQLTLTVLALLAMLVLVFILGLLMQFSIIVKSSKLAEDVIIKLVPSLNHLKLLAAEKLSVEDANTEWKPVLVKTDDGFVAAYLIEQSEDLATFSKIVTPGIEPGEIFIKEKKSTKYIEITMTQLLKYNKQFGKGFIALIEK